MSSDRLFYRLLATRCCLFPIPWSLLLSPRAVDVEGVKAFGFAFGQRVLDDMVDSRAARTSVKARAKFVEIAGVARSQDLDFALLGITHPPAQFQLAGLALHEPAEAYTLHATLNEEMNDHQL